MIMNINSEVLSRRVFFFFFFNKKVEEKRSILELSSG